MRTNSAHIYIPRSHTITHCARFARESSLLPKLPNSANHNIRQQS
nr:MAG TPA: putative transposon-encoded protein [Caudoviricetes sp.]